MNQFPCGCGISLFVPEQTAAEQVKGIKLGSSRELLIFHFI
jgi:hypothetical protein